MAQADSPRERPAEEPFHDFRRQPLEYSGPEDEEPAPANLAEIVIGWFGPSDSSHPLHGDLWTAASLAVDEANRTVDDAGGSNGRPFRLAPRWSKNVWGSGVSLVTRMAYEDRVWAILGSVDGTSTHLAEQVVAKARLPLVSPVSTDESVNLAGVPWMFSVAPGDHLWAPTLAASLVATIGDGDFVMITTTDHDSRLATDSLLDELAELDRVPAFLLDIQPESPDSVEQIAGLNLSEVSALLVVAGAEDGGNLLPAIRRSRFSGPLFGAPSLARRQALEAAGNAAEGLRVPLLRTPGPKDTESLAFERLFRERAGFAPDWAAAHTYDATRLLLEAIATAGPSRSGIREALVELSPWQGITGVIEWDPTGQNQRPVTEMATVRGGRLVAD